MQRDIELIRKILLKIEEKYIDVTLYDRDINIDGYDMKTVAYNCSLLHTAGLVGDYKGYCSDNGLLSFSVGSLTWDGHELLGKIENDTVWNNTKETITKRGIPFVLDAVMKIATALTTKLIESAITGL